jgi:dTDP-4-amino-4,6-dideoxygalactose transaminase
MKNLVRIENPVDHIPSNWLYTVLTDYKVEFIEFLASRGIQSGSIHQLNHRHKLFKSEMMELPNLEKFYAKMVHIPIGPWLDSSDVNKIVLALRDFDKGLN